MVLVHFEVLEECNEPSDATSYGMIGLGAFKWEILIESR